MESSVWIRRAWCLFDFCFKIQFNTNSWTFFFGGFGHRYKATHYIQDRPYRRTRRLTLGGDMASVRDGLRGQPGNWHIPGKIAGGRQDFVIAKNICKRSWNVYYVLFYTFIIKNWIRNIQEFFEWVSRVTYNKYVYELVSLDTYAILIQILCNTEIFHRYSEEKILHQQKAPLYLSGQSQTIECKVMVILQNIALLCCLQVQTTEAFSGPIRAPKFSLTIQSL